MNITRNNYEEYFLLYADGELTIPQKKEVEEFVKAHPDLREELQLLTETILDADAMIKMPGKEMLVKPVEWSEETLSPQQENLLMYLDNELTQEQVKELQEQLQHNKLLSKEWGKLCCNAP